ncbi:hypothetical protein E3C22_13445 [Jiella endophytica]|uniref:Flagellar protein FlgJ N-terminal domain-containing protein n=1 Tax=Jiella endophytica TaxID=2558362 RepID=A0A4Y8RGS6_9HYPH|nr:rod-binding protein [Jiella endophytica]TFF21691.1 hypothetical protein E3C22_13445 [Jiella endophytica]
MTAITDFTIHPAALAKTQTDMRSQASRPAGTDAASESFAVALDSAKGAAEAGATGTAAETTLRPLVKHEAREVPALEQFEGFVLRTFIESMLPSEASEFFGKGTAGSIWRSMMAEQIGNEIAKGGGVGIADTIAKKDGTLSAERARVEASHGAAELGADAGMAAAASVGSQRRGG